jgi:dTDP-4-dehydrorhamnose reductase
LQDHRENPFAAPRILPDEFGVPDHSFHPPRIRAILLGGSGLLGAALREAWSAQPDIELLPLSRAELNLTQPDRIAEVLEGVPFDLLLNAAAYTRVDDAETSGGRELAMTVNGTAAGVLADCAARKAARMIHFSTDYVFDGSSRTPYRESDTPSPVSVYGQSKLVGEELVLAASPRHLVVRLSWLCGPARPAFPEWLLSQAMTRPEVRVIADKWACPTWAPDLAERLLDLVRMPAETAGVLHFCHGPPCSWLDWGQQILDTAAAAGRQLQTTRLTPVSIAELPGMAARRPTFSALATDRFVEITGEPPRPWTTWLPAMAGLPSHGS